MVGNTDWWRGSVIYQIYPRSFMDASGDGTGDLSGITSRLEYVADLGVDAIWVSPFFTSPMKDFGYDVANYREVDPLFGTLNDFDQLVDKAHTLGLKVIIDQVLSHTSDQHPWFEQSRQDRDNDRADWYVWADPRVDGTPPNNWLAFFGGSAWTWDSRRRQYYLHNFLDSQPDLNFHNPAVREAQLDNLRFWLERGVDGFRLDVVNFFFHSEGLEDNPPVADDSEMIFGLTRDNPYAWQRHVYDISRPENLDFLKRIRALTNSYDDVTTVGEISGQNAVSTLIDYTTGDDLLHMAYTFSLLTKDGSPGYIRGVIQDLEAGLGDAWPCWALSNHDVERCVSRWGTEETADQAALARVLIVLLGCLRGSVCLYQGEELGLPQADVPFERIQDPYGLPFWPQYKGRDGCRTPMPWTSDPLAHGGFSTSEPWLPQDPRHLAFSVDAQVRAADSTLNFTRSFLNWRKRQTALVAGALTLVDAGDLLAWVRRSDEQSLLVVINVLPEAREAVIDVSIERVVDIGLEGRFDNGRVQLPAYGGLVADLKQT